MTLPLAAKHRPARPVEPAAPGATLAGAGGTAAVGALPGAAADDARIAHLFRAARRAGRIHPLQHLLQRHRGWTVAATTVAGPAAAAGGAARPLLPPAAGHAIDCALLHQRVNDLPALPQAALQALAALRDDSAASEHCAALISRDQALAARTLRLANSPFYGVSGRVDSVLNALHLLGRRTLCSVLTVACVSQQFGATAGAANPAPRFAVFWRHAIAVALAARALALALDADDEQAFTAGLLHDIGELALAAHFPQATAATLQRALALDTAPREVERDVAATDHAEVGALVAAHWHFPAAVVQALGAHHAPAAAPGGGASLGDLLHVADAIVHALDIADDPHDSVPVLDAACWQRLGLPPQQLLTVFADTEAGVAQLCRAMGLA